MTPRRGHGRCAPGSNQCVFRLCSRQPHQGEVIERALAGAMVVVLVTANRRAWWPLEVRDAIQGHGGEISLGDTRELLIAMAACGLADRLPSGRYQGRPHSWHQH